MLNNLAILCIEKDMIKHVDVDTIISHFASKILISHFSSTIINQFLYDHLNIK